MSTPYYLTTSISYPNGAPHIGHAYEALSTDTMARFKRLDGYRVFFLTGTDEHGIKMQQMAHAQGMKPKDFATRNTRKFQEMVKALNCSHDDFIRTTEPRHHTASQEIWRRMAANGDIYQDTYSGWYSVRDEAYYDESELLQGERGERLSPQGTPVEWIEEESYFFRLSAYGDRLLAHYEANPSFIGPATRRNETIRFVASGLRDLSISRTAFDWGIRVPGDEAHVMYVWVDALTNYITGVGFPDDHSARFRDFWPADLHIIGKDILRFHAVYWPAFLMSAGLTLPKRVFAHGFLLNKGEKMSTSVGNVVDPFALVEAFGADQLRYFLLREVPFGQDGSYSHVAIVTRINAELANDLGNLAQRSLSMIARNCAGLLPHGEPFDQADEALLSAATELLTSLRPVMDAQQFHTALIDIWQVVGQANRYFAAQAPWVLKKTNPVRMETVLYVTAEVLRRLGILLQPFVPDAASHLLDLLGVKADARQFVHLDDEHRLHAGIALPPPQAIFPRYQEDSANA